MKEKLRGKYKLSDDLKCYTVDQAFALVLINGYEYVNKLGIDNNYYKQLCRRHYDGILSHKTKVNILAKAGYKKIKEELWK